MQYAYRGRSLLRTHVPSQYLSQYCRDIPDFAPITSQCPLLIFLISYLALLAMFKLTFWCIFFLSFINALKRIDHKVTSSSRLPLNLVWNTSLALYNICKWFIYHTKCSLYMLLMVQTILIRNYFTERGRLLLNESQKIERSSDSVKLWPFRGFDR